MNELRRTILHHCTQMGRYLRVARLRLQDGLLIPLLPPVMALLLAAKGMPTAGPALGVLLLALLGWGLAWCYFELVEFPLNMPRSRLVQGVLTRQQALWGGVVAALLALLLALLLGSKVLALLPVTVAVVALFPWLRRRSYLADAWFAVGLAWMVLLAYAALGQWPDKVALLLAVASLAWQLAWRELQGWPHQLEEAQHGLRSLGQMFGPATAHLIAGLQLSALLGWWLVGVQAALDHAFTLGWVMALLLSLAQYVLLLRSGSGAVRQAGWLHYAIAGVIALALMAALRH